MLVASSSTMVDHCNKSSASYVKVIGLAVYFYRFLCIT